MPNALPPARAFKRARVAANVAQAIRWLLQLREPPASRPDLQRCIPDDNDCDLLLHTLDGMLPSVKQRPSVQRLVAECGLTDDDLRILLAYTVESPYPLYRWLNGFLTDPGRQGPTIVDHVGPAYVHLYRALEKLPRVTANAHRSVMVRNVPGLRAMFDNSKTRLQPGSKLGFWGFSSFTTDAAVMNSPAFLGGQQEEAIVYVCGQLTGVQLEPFRPEGMPSEAELLPLCPALFSVTAVTRIGNKVVVTLQQEPHEDFAYVEPAASPQAVAQAILWQRHTGDNVAPATAAVAVGMLRAGQPLVADVSKDVVATSLAAFVNVRAGGALRSDVGPRLVISVASVIASHANEAPDAFSIAPVRDAIVTLSRFATTADAAESLARAVCSIMTTSNPECNAVFVVSRVRDALVSLAQYAPAGDAAHWLARAVCTVSDGCTLPPRPATTDDGTRGVAPEPVPSLQRPLDETATKPLSRRNVLPALCVVLLLVALTFFATHAWDAGSISATTLSAVGILASVLACTLITYGEPPSLSELNNLLRKRRFLTASLNGRGAAVAPTRYAVGRAVGQPFDDDRQAMVDSFVADAHGVTPLLLDHRHSFPKVCDELRAASRRASLLPSRDAASIADDEARKRDEILKDERAEWIDFVEYEVAAKPAIITRDEQRMRRATALYSNDSSYSPQLAVASPRAASSRRYSSPCFTLREQQQQASDSGDAAASLGSDERGMTRSLSSIISESSAELGVNEDEESMYLGEGGGGSVEKVYAAKLGRDIAMKKVTGWSKSQKKCIQKEIETLCTLRDCPYIVKIYGFCRRFSTYHIFMELMENSVSRHLEHNIPLEGLRRDWLRDALHGLHAMHEKGLVHRDIKPGNLLIYQDSSERRQRVKLGDFGIVRKVNEDKTLTAAGKGTPFFMAPESLFHPPNYGPAVDVWGLACTWICMATCRKNPWHGVIDTFPDFRDFVTRIQRDPAIRPRIPEELLPKAACKLLDRMLQRNPADRITVAELLRSDYFCDGQQRPVMPQCEQPAVAGCTDTDEAAEGEVQHQQGQQQQRPPQHAATPQPVPADAGERLLAPPRPLACSS